MRFSDIILEGRDASLWHGYRDIDHVIKALKNDEMLGTSTQRWWKDEKHYTDDQGDVYENSFWMKGISFTRDKKFAQNWGSVVFEIDQKKLSQNYKIIPFSWQKTFSRKEGAYKPHFKREREEFLILEKEPNTFMFPDEDDFDKPRFDVNAFKTPAKKSVKPLSRYLLGIWVDKSVEDIYTGRKYNNGGPEKKDERFEFLKQHSLFKGYY